VYLGERMTNLRRFSILYFFEVDCDFLSVIERIGDYGVFLRIAIVGVIVDKEGIAAVVLV
jgi:hypothetical protein